MYHTEEASTHIRSSTRVERIGGPSSSATVSGGMSLREPRRRTLMSIVSVRMRAESDKTVETNAFLDSGSSTCLMTEQLADRLGSSKQPMSM